MPADDVQLDLVNRLQLRGRSEVGEYFHWYAAAGTGTSQPESLTGVRRFLVVDPAEPEGPPPFFILLEWADEAVVPIRDFLFARYVMDGADVRTITS